MADDRATGIFGDQIKDYSLGSDELNTEQQGEIRRKWMTLIFKPHGEGQMKWGFSFGNRILK